MAEQFTLQFWHHWTVDRKWRLLRSTVRHPHYWPHIG